jgi:Uma2 family endonuclease
LRELTTETRPTEPGPVLWTRRAFYDLMEMQGVDRMPVELIEGELVAMAAQSNVHAVLIEKACRSLRKVFKEDEYWVRVEATLDLSNISAPDPDVAVVRGSFESWELSKDNPQTALLVVEVGVTTIGYDRRRKASMYAKNGVEDYWVIDALNKRLEVRRQPVPDATEQYGFGYAQIMSYHAGDTVSPLAMPSVKISVSDLLPR